MNTRQTIRNRSELEMDNDSDEEKNRERNRERETARDTERDPTRRRITGAESQVRSRGVGGSKRTLHDVAFGRTPPKRLHPKTVSSHTYTATGARPKEPVVRYRGTEPSDTGRGGQALTRRATEYTSHTNVGDCLRTTLWNRTHLQIL